MFTKVLILTALAALACGNPRIKMPKEGEDMLRRLCRENGAEKKADAAIAGYNRSLNCFRLFTDVTSVLYYIAGPMANKDAQGQQDMVKMYCNQAADNMRCLNGLIESVSPCISDTMHKQMNANRNASRAFIEYNCYNNGERLVAFYANRGADCINESANELTACSQVYQNGSEDDNVKGTWSTDTFCNKFVEFSSCAVEALRKCDPAPADYMETVYTYMKNNTICKRH